MEKKVTLRHCIILLRRRFIFLYFGHALELLFYPLYLSLIIEQFDYPNDFFRFGLFHSEAKDLSHTVSPKILLILLLFLVARNILSNFIEVGQK